MSTESPRRRRGVIIGAGTTAIAALCAGAVVLVSRSGDDSPTAKAPSLPTATVAGAVEGAGGGNLKLLVEMRPEGRAITVKGSVASAAQADIIRSAAFAIDQEAKIDIQVPDGSVATNAQERSVAQLVALMSGMPSHLSRARVTMTDVTLTVVGDARGTSQKRDLARLFDRMEASGVYVRRNIRDDCGTATLACFNQQVTDAVGGNGVAFEAGSFQLSGRAYESVEDLSFLMRANPTLRVSVTGHGDGSAAAARLARQRAEEVVAEIVDHEVDPGRVTSRSTATGGNRVEIELTR